MGLLPRRVARQPTSRAGAASHDTRPRDYVLEGCPVVGADDVVVLVDAVVRLEVRQDREHEPGYDPGEELALHTAFVLALRLLAERVPSEELLVGRALVVEALEHGFAFAPVGTGLTARTTHVEVRRYDPAAVGYRHEFRLADR